MQTIGRTGLREIGGWLAIGSTILWGIGLPANISWAAYTGTPPLIVANGGTGAVTLTAHGVLLGQGTSAITALSPGNDSVVLWQTSGADPIASALSSCSGATNALSYNTSTHAFGCNTISTSGTPGGSNKEFQYNNSSAFAGSAALTNETGLIGVDYNTTAISSFPTALTGTVLRVAAADGTASRITLDSFGTSVPSKFTGACSRGTAASPTAIQSGDACSNFNTAMYNGSGYNQGNADLQGVATENQDGTHAGAKLVFYTTANTTTSTTARLDIENDGGITAPPAVTGGDKGAGSINATTLWQAGVAVATVAPVNVLTGSSPFTLASVAGTTNISRMGTPAAGTYHLPSAVTAGSGFKSCLKDDTTNFATNNATVDSTSGNIDGSASIVMKQAKQEFCFVSDGTNWFIE